MKLKNAQHEEFCQRYIISLNATKAADEAKYSKKTAYSQGQRLLKNVEIQKRITELKKIRSERTVITQDMVLKELWILARSDFKDYGEIVKDLAAPEGRLKLKMFKDIEGDATRAIKSISEHITKDGIQLKFKLHGKDKPLELLCRHLGMLIEKFDIGDDLKKLLVERVFTDKRPKK